VINTHQAPWFPGLEGVLDVKVHHDFGSEQLLLMHWTVSSSFHRHGGEEIMVLTGAFPVEHGRYPAGCRLRNPSGSVDWPRTGPKQAAPSG